MDKSAFLERLEAQLKVFDAEIQRLSARAEKVRVDLKADLNEQLKKLKQDRESAQKKLDDLRGKGNEAWEEMREGAEAAWKELKTGLDRAMEKFH